MCLGPPSTLASPSVSLTRRQLVSSVQLTSFSDFRSRGSSDFLSAKEYVEYLNQYCDHFDLWPHIRLGCQVEGLEKQSSASYVMTVSGVNVVD